MSLWSQCLARPTLPWKVMTSAPKDGTKVLLADWVGLVMQGYWDGAVWRLTTTGNPEFEPVQWATIPPIGENSL